MAECAQQVVIERPSEEVWQILSGFDHVEDWAPFVEQSYLTTVGTPGVGSRRTLRHKWGFSLEEVVTEWDVGQGFSYTVSGVPYPLTDFRESWSIKTNGAGAVVTTRMSYRVGLGPMGGLVDFLIVRPLLRRAVRLGHRGLKRHVESDRAASRLG